MTTGTVLGRPGERRAGLEDRAGTRMRASHTADRPLQDVHDLVVVAPPGSRRPRARPAGGPVTSVVRAQAVVLGATEVMEPAGPAAEGGRQARCAS